MEDPLGACSSTCTHQNQWGFIKMCFLTPAALCPTHLLLDLGLAVGGGGLERAGGSPATETTVE